MPTTSETLGSYVPRRMPMFQSGKTMPPASTVQQMTAEQFVPFDVKPPNETPSATPRQVQTSMDDVPEVASNKKKTCRGAFLLASLIALLLLAAVAVGITVPLVILRKTTATTSTSATSTIPSLTSSPSTTVTTTTVVCVSPYVRAPSGNCVNVLIDLNNCGSIGNNCSANYTSCSGGVCSAAPGVQLANANFIWTAAINGSVDDAYYPVTLPLNITLYNTTVNLVSVTTNGVLCFGPCSTAYTETSLPTGTFPGVTVFPYWDDLYIYSGTSQGIYYGVQGNAPNRTLTFEFYMSHFSQSNQYYHYQVLFFEARPNIVQNRYFQASDGGASCTVGVQAFGSGPFIQYSFDLANSVQQNTSLTFDTTLGVYTNSTF